MLTYRIQLYQETNFPFLLYSTDKTYLSLAFYKSRNKLDFVQLTYGWGMKQPILFWTIIKYVHSL